MVSQWLCLFVCLWLHLLVCIEWVVSNDTHFNTSTVNQSLGPGWDQIPLAHLYLPPPSVFGD